MVYIVIILFLSLKVTAQEVIKSEIVIKETSTIYFIGGIASVITEEDLTFAKKHNIKYHDFGCLAPANREKYEKLNAQVFDQLNKEFGIHWQKEMRKGILGYEKWKKS